MNLILLYINIAIVVLTTFISSVFLITLFVNRNRLFEDPKPKRFPSVSIGIPAYNEEKNIAKTLKHVLGLDYPRKIEIIVVNDGSTDRTKEIVERIAKKDKNIILINREKRSGRKAVPINVALKKAKGEIFGSVDADVYVEKNILRNIIGYFNDKKVGAVITGMKVYNPKNTIEKLQQIEYIFGTFVRKLLTFLNCLYTGHGCVFVRRKVLKSAGGFDENNITEDMEIGLKLHKKKYVIENSVNAFSYAVVPKNVKNFLRQRIRWYRGLIYNVRKYKELFFEKSDFGIFLMPLVLIGGVSLIFLYGFLLALSAYDILYNLLAVFGGIILSKSILVPGIVIEPIIIMFFAIFLLFFLIVNIYASIKITREKFNILKNSILFLIFYSPLLFIAWIISLTKEIFRSEVKW